MDWRGYFQDPSDFMLDGGTSINLQDKGYTFYNAKGAEEALNRKDENWLLINSGNSTKLYQIRDEETVYEDAYVANWTVAKKTTENGAEETMLVPVKVTSFEEKARYVNCQNSNKYNITQSIAEAFGVFCSYEYEVDQQGYFKGTYWDDIGRVWTGKKVVFYNRAVKTDDPITINYQHNLSTISRTIDSSELYTKMYVVPIESETMDTGYITIADTPSNPLLDDFILNFDYLYKIGSITTDQYEWIEKYYKVELHTINQALVQLEERYNDLQADKNQVEANLTTAKNELASAQEQLGNYQTLRDNDTYQRPVIKDATNGYSVTFVPQTASNISQGTFRLTGISPTEIECYNNSAYEHSTSTDTTSGMPHKCLFSTLGREAEGIPAPVFVKESPGQAEAMPDKWFIVVDEDGFPSHVYTSLAHPTTGANGTYTKNFTTGAIYYFKLKYWPKNKYVAVCDRFEKAIAQKEALIKDLEKQLDHIFDENSPEEEKWYGLNQQLENLEKTRKQLLKDKDRLNYDFERLLGPAVREGYWQANDYEDPGQGYNVIFSKENGSSESNTHFIFDSEPFEDEQTSHYLSASEEGYVDVYYPYIDLSPICSAASDVLDNVNEFIIELEHPEFEAEITEATFPSSQPYKIVYNSEFYYFKIDQDLPKGSHLYLQIVDTAAPESPIRDMKMFYSLPDSEILTPIEWITEPNQDIIWLDITTRFEGLQQFLGVKSLYNNAGFKFGFMDIGTSKDENGEHLQNIIPVALLQETNILYDHYTSISYATSSTGTRYRGKLKVSSNSETKFPMVYPRIFIDYRNVNHASDNLTIRSMAKDKLDVETGEVMADGFLEKYEDYQVLLRKGKPYITLKITNANPFRYLLYYNYNIIYQVSRANEMLFLDARQVAKDSSKPKYSYEVSIGNVPDEMECAELGQLVYICDYTIDAERERGYISGIKYKLDEPSEDTITISNYKTKFEDLFASISAQNETMKQNQTIYNIAAQSFTANGEITQETLQNTLDNTDAVFSFGNNTITLDKNGGMILTNQSAYYNGVYGQIKLIGGGIFCSDSIDSDGNRLWTTGITPQGINASLITAGQIDTKYIRILSGDQTRFQWNESGLYSFGDDVDANEETGRINLDTTTFVRLNEEGLLFQKKNQQLLSLDWAGLHIGAQDGSVELSSENGLEVFNKLGNRLVKLGRHEDNADELAALYGLAMYNVEGNKTLYTDQNGNLHLTGKLTVGEGEGFVCLNGAAKADADYVFFAGNENPEEAEFALRRDGKIFSKGELVVLTTTTDPDPAPDTGDETIRTYIVKNGENIDNSNVWGTYYNDSSIIVQDGVMRIKLPSNSTETADSIYQADKTDFTNYSVLRCQGYYTGDSTGALGIANDDGDVASRTFTNTNSTISIDISSLEGKYWITFYIYRETEEANLYITDIWFE